MSSRAPRGTRDRSSRHGATVRPAPPVPAFRSKTGTEGTDTSGGHQADRHAGGAPRDVFPSVTVQSLLSGVIRKLHRQSARNGSGHTWNGTTHVARPNRKSIRGHKLYSGGPHVVSG